MLSGCLNESNTPKVTVCIPTFQSESFIDRTLAYARNQTYPNLRILVSIDQSSDQTKEICQRHAHEDCRVEVFTQSERLGWARNINFLLEKVTSEYFFIYPHDDIIDATYTEVLLSRLRQRPDAASVQCNVLFVQPGGEQGIYPGRDQEGPVSRRILASLVSPFPGEPLRSLIRTAVAGDRLRFPPTSFRGYYAQVPFQARLFAAGPALHVPAILYWRWSSRKGGMVDSWATLSVGDVAADVRCNVEDCLELIESCSASSDEKTVLRFAVYLNQLGHLRAEETRRGAAVLLDPRLISPTFDFSGVPSALSSLAPEIQRWIIARYVSLVREESLHYWRRGDFKNALARLRTLRAGDVASAVPPAVGRRLAQRVRRRPKAVELPPDLRARLGQ